MRPKRSVIVLPLAVLTWALGSACGDPAEAPNPDPSGNGGNSGGNSGAGNGGSSGAGPTGSGALGGAAGSAGSAQGGSETNAGAAGQGGQEEEPVPPGPPVIESLTPSAGPYGEVVTISGAFLGSSARAGVQLRIGPAPAFAITPADDGYVESWTEDEIRFRYPFPAEGAIAIDTPQGSADIGEFTSTWRTELTATNAPAASVIASISTAPKSVALLFDSTPPVLMELGPESSVIREVTLNGAVASSIRLYLAGDVIEGIGVSDGEEPVLVHLVNVDGNLVGELTDIALDATETALAGGPDGACAWLHRSDGWWRARPISGEWALAEGPIADTEPTSPERAVGASSDGSLYIAWPVDAGNWFDDMEAPRMRRLNASTLEWGGTQSAGGAVDDYITSLEILDKGRGVVVRYCGSDLDPWGVSSTSYSCYDGLHTPLGAYIAKVSVDVTASRHAFAASRAVAGYCDSGGTFRLRTDTDTAAAPGEPVGEAIVFPCQSTVALEIDSDGDYVPIIRRGALLHRLGRRPPE